MSKRALSGARHFEALGRSAASRGEDRQLLERTILRQVTPAALKAYRRGFSFQKAHRA